MTYNHPESRRVAAILATHRTGAPCVACGIAHNGAAWSPVAGWHDYTGPAAVQDGPIPGPEPGPHDPDAAAGAPCVACGPAVAGLAAWRDVNPHLRRYLITAARAAGASVCGHWHAEHATDSAEDMDRLAAELGARHASVEVWAWAESAGGFVRLRAIDRGDRASSAPCCRPIDGPDRADFQTRTRPNGARCFYCGDLLARWTH